MYVVPLIALAGLVGIPATVAALLIVGGRAAYVTYNKNRPD
jgi:hypothetical protein